MLKSLPFALLTLSSVALAQNLPAPNETDLKANYCVAIVQDSVSHLERARHDPAKPFKSEDEQKLSAALDAGLANAQADLKHLRVYLAPRLKQIDVAPMGAVKMQAESDIKSAQAERARCAAQCPSNVPAASAAEPSQQTRNACLNTCYSGIAVAARMKACSPTNWLPN